MLAESFGQPRSVGRAATGAFQESFGELRSVGRAVTGACKRASECWQGCDGSISREPRRASECWQGCTGNVANRVQCHHGSLTDTCVVEAQLELDYEAAETDVLQAVIERSSDIATKSNM